MTARYDAFEELYHHLCDQLILDTYGAELCCVV